MPGDPHPARPSAESDLPTRGVITLTAHDRHITLPPAGANSVPGPREKFMNKIVEAILAEFSKDSGIAALPEKDRFEHLTAFLTIRRHFSRALDLDDVVIGDGGDT